MNNPLVSVIIPTKNSAKTLEACLESIKNQSYKNIEIIVVDNNSTDDTKNIAGRYTDKVFNKGPERSAQRNFGVQNSKGGYVIIIDSDMELSEDVIDSCVNKVSGDTEIKCLVIPEESFGEGFWAQCKKLERSFYVGVEWMEAARFFDKVTYQSLGGYNEEMVSGEDWDLSQRFEVLGKLNRIDDLIYHNEGNLKLIGLLKKKYYYSRKLSVYWNNNSEDEKVKKQIGIFYRYKLFLSKPSKLFKNPFIGLGVIFMKTAEFSFGFLGYLVGYLRKNKHENVEELSVEVLLPSLSFIIPTFNSEEFLDKCLSSIVKQNYPKDKIEILIIEGGSSDLTLQIALKYSVRIIKNERRIAEYAKSIGILESRGDYFILMDSDNEIVEKNWLESMVKPIIENPELFGVESALSYDHGLSSLNRYFARMRIADPLAKCLASKPVKIDIFSGYSILNFSNNAVLITGANGFLWNKKMVMEFSEWRDKFEEANFATFIHDKKMANYAVPDNVSIRHYYCSSFRGYLSKRKKIAQKIKGRIKNKEYVWINKINTFKILFYIIYLSTIIGPLIESIYRNLRNKTTDYFWHPLISVTTIYVYTYNFLKKK